MSVQDILTMVLVGSVGLAFYIADRINESKKSKPIKDDKP